jgi:hypothetical protein
MPQNAPECPRISSSFSSGADKIVYDRTDRGISFTISIYNSYRSRLWHMAALPVHPSPRRARSKFCHGLMVNRVKGQIHFQSLNPSLPWRCLSQQYFWQGCGWRCQQPRALQVFSSLAGWNNSHSAKKQIWSMNILWVRRSRAEVSGCSVCSDY